MGRKKKLKQDDPEESARFIEVAERILDEDAERQLDEAMKRILRAGKTTQPCQSTREAVGED